MGEGGGQSSQLCHYKGILFLCMICFEPLMDSRENQMGLANWSPNVPIRLALDLATSFGGGWCLCEEEYNRRKRSILLPSTFRLIVCLLDLNIKLVILPE